MISKQLHRIVIGSSLLLLFFLCNSCGNKQFFIKNNDGKIIDNRLIGTWEGSETNSLIEGMSSEWQMTRNSDGSFTLIVHALVDGAKEVYTELGSWWIENGLFYELHNDTGKTDIYFYEVLNKRQIKFKAKQLAFEAFKKDYEFIDTLISN